MTISPVDDFTAAEYALGTLDASERASLAARRLRDPEIDEAIRGWEARLAPLAEAVPEIEPPRDLLPAIEARIRGASPEAPGNGAIVELERSVRRWRAMAIAASLFAGVLVCSDPAEGPGFTRLRGDGQSRQAGIHGSTGRGASPAGQVV